MTNINKLILNSEPISPDKTRLYHTVEFLSSITPTRNYKNIDSLKTAFGFIWKAFAVTRLKIFKQEWEVQGRLYQNIVAQYQPENKTRFVVGAHYDVYKETPGADDNASGIAGLLELALMIDQKHPQLDFGIDFVAYCLEEPPFFRTQKMGSFIHAKSLFDHQNELLGMISLEMIGYFGEEWRPDFAGVRESDNAVLGVSGLRRFEPFNRKVAEFLKGQPGLAIRVVNFADNYRNAGPSDHRNYWGFGFPGVMLIGSSREKNRHYHQATDKIETLNFDFMAKVIERCYHLLIGF